MFVNNKLVHFLEIMINLLFFEYFWYLFWLLFLLDLIWLVTGFVLWREWKKEEIYGLYLEEAFVIVYSTINDI